MKPSDLLLVMLGGCTDYDVVDILLKKRQQLAGLEAARDCATMRCRT